MKVKIVNRTDLQQFIDCGGGKKPEDIVPIPPKATIIVEMLNEKVFIDNAKKYKNKLILRKL